MLLCRIPLQILSGVNFWNDICRSRDEIVFYYHFPNTAAAKNSALSGWKQHQGKLNEVVSKALVKLCKEKPFSFIAHQKDFMITHGAGDLFNLKSKVVRELAENLVR